MVEIPQSHTAHQAFDKKYYKRFNFNSEPMHDYEIRDILNRTKFPIIDLEFEIITRTFEVKNQNYNFPPISLIVNERGMMKPEIPKKEFKTNYTLRVFARNIGKVFSKYLNSYVYIPDNYLIEPVNSKDYISNVFMENTIRDIVDSKIITTMAGGYASPKYGPSRYDPILPTRSFLLKEIKINKSFKESNNDLNWIVFTDNAEPRKGRIKIQEIEVYEK